MNQDHTGLILSCCCAHTFLRNNNGINQPPWQRLQADLHQHRQELDLVPAPHMTASCCQAHTLVNNRSKGCTFLRGLQAGLIQRSQALCHAGLASVIHTVRHILHKEAKCSDFLSLKGRPAIRIHTVEEGCPCTSAFQIADRTTQPPPGMAMQLSSTAQPFQAGAALRGQASQLLTRSLALGSSKCCADSGCCMTSSTASDRS